MGQRSCPIASGGDHPNIAAAREFQLVIAPRLSVEITATGDISTVSFKFASSSSSTR